jgi:hypothetical protein
MSTDDKPRPVEGIVGRSCTCHPDDNPPNPCARIYALTECRRREQEERAMFEYWMSDGGEWPKAIERSRDGYKLAQSQQAWTVWKARAYLTPNMGVVSE